MEKIGILGYGEIGRSIAKFYQHPKIKDLKRDDNLKGVDILHVCIPYSKQFVKIVLCEVKNIAPKLTIIHSSVPVGTTQKIGGAVVHSPVRGVHPLLFDGLKTFVKFIGFDDPKYGKLARDHFSKLGVEVITSSDSRNSEALKLWSTTQYGLMILLNKEIKRYCVENKLDFNFVYTLANRTYNKGYEGLGRSEVVRPYLKYMEGNIGGHCVIPNCKLLKSFISNLITKKNKDYV